MESLFWQRDGAVFNDLLARDGWPVSAAICSGVTFGVNGVYQLYFAKCKLFSFVVIRSGFRRWG